MFLWERILSERPLGTRLGWLLRHNLLLLLQLLAAVALIVALADPALLHFGSSAGDLIVVIDLSASMKANGQSGSRFERARREFDNLIEAMSGTQKMMVIGAGVQPRLLMPFTATSGAYATSRASWKRLMRRGESRKRFFSPILS